MIQQKNMFSNKKTIFVNGPVLRNEIKYLTQQKTLLEELKNKMQTTQDTLVSSDMSGLSFQKTVEKNETSIKNSTDEIAEFNTIIEKLENACSEYDNSYFEIEKSVNGGQQ